MKLKIPRHDIWRHECEDMYDIRNIKSGEWQKFVSDVEEFNKMLNEGIEVWTQCDHGTTCINGYGITWDQKQRDVDTHKALLINIQSVGFDTLEGVFEDFIANVRDGKGDIQEISKRAKKIISIVTGKH